MRERSRERERKRANYQLSATGKIQDEDSHFRSETVAYYGFAAQVGPTQ